MKNKIWIIWTAVALVTLLLVVVFAENIRNWVANTIVDILIYVIVFAAGWLLGRYGNHGRKPDSDRP